MGLSGAALGLIAYVGGLPLAAAFLVGAGLALSSTAAVLQRLMERNAESTPLGRAAVGILLFQDLLVIFLLVLVQALAEPEVALLAALAMALVKAALAVAAVFVIGRFVLEPVFRAILGREHEEIFTATVLLVVLATASATGLAGLSMPLGAFLAGLIISETDYCYMVTAELRPFRGFLLGLFFITVGMSLELPVVFAQAPLLILLVVDLTVVKTVGLAVPARLTRFPTSCSVRLGLLLSQGSEFAFVLFALMAAEGLLAGSLASLLIAAVAVSIACTPALTVAGRRIARWLERPDERAAAADRQGPVARGRMLISGLDEAARTVARALDAVDIAYLALEDDAERFAQARGDGFNVSFGNANRLDLLDAAGADTARTIVVAPDDSAEADSLMAALRRRYPGVPLLARASNPEHAERLRRSGATVAADDDGPSGAALATEALRLLGVAEERIDAWLAEQSRAAARDLEPGEAVPRPT